MKPLMILSSDVPSRKIEQTFNIGRLVARFGLPDSVGGMSCNRFCSSGLQTIAIAAAEIQAGIADVIVAGGVESMTAHCPISYETMKKSYQSLGYGKISVPITWIWDPPLRMLLRNVTLPVKEMDAFAVKVAKAAAWDAGHLAASIIPLDGIDRKAIHRFDQDLKRGFAAVQPWNPWLLSSLVSKRMAL